MDADKPGERLEQIEAALAAPLPDAEEAKVRLAYLCNSMEDDAINWRRKRNSDELLELEDARLRYVVAVHRLRAVAETLSRHILEKA
jgi:hypothetical protein